MPGVELSNKHLSVRIGVGYEQGSVRGIQVASISDLQNKHQYLLKPTSLFEFAVNDGPPRRSSGDLVVTRHEINDFGKQDKGICAIPR